MQRIYNRKSNTKKLDESKMKKREKRLADGTNEQHDSVVKQWRRWNRKRMKGTSWVSAIWCDVIFAQQNTTQRKHLGNQMREEKNKTAIQMATQH